MDEMATTTGTLDDVEVDVVYSAVGESGPGWYVWETEYHDEGYVGHFDHRPTEAELKAICASYVETK